MIGSLTPHVNVANSGPCGRSAVANRVVLRAADLRIPRTPHFNVENLGPCGRSVVATHSPYPGENSGKKQNPCAIGRLCDLHVADGRAPGAPHFNVDGLGPWDVGGGVRVQKQIAQAPEFSTLKGGVRGVRKSAARKTMQKASNVSSRFQKYVSRYFPLAMDAQNKYNCFCAGFSRQEVFWEVCL